MMPAMKNKLQKAIDAGRSLLDTAERKYGQPNPQKTVRLKMGEKICLELEESWGQKVENKLLGAMLSDFTLEFHDDWRPMNNGPWIAGPRMGGTATLSFPFDLRSK